MSSAVSLQSTMRPAASGLGRQLHGSPPCHGPVLRPRRPQAVATVRCGVFRRNHYGGALVDEGMAVLRRRIQETRMAEANYEPPPGCAPWERRYYPAYVSDVSTLAGALQLLAMDTRPGVTAAVAAMVLAGVPVSAVFALHLLGQAAGSVLRLVS